MSPLLRVSAWALGFTPLWLGWIWSWVVARLWWWVVPVRKRVGVANLKAAFPEADEAWIRRTLTSMMHNLVLGYIEMLVFERRRVRHRLEGEIAPGTLVLAGHGGHWDIALLALADHSPTAIFLKTPKNQAVHAVMANIRDAHGVRRLETGASLADGLAAVAAGYSLLFIQDQRFNDGLQSPFFGRPCLTSAAFAIAALKSGRPVCGYWQWREGLGRHRFVLSALPLPTPTGDRQADARSLTDACNAWYEARIREHPEGWLWLHDRWKGGRGNDAEPRRSRMSA